jgi:hypothetical protein
MAKDVFSGKMENGSFKLPTNRRLNRTRQYNYDQEGGEILVCNSPGEYCGTSISDCRPQFGILPFRGLPCEKIVRDLFCGQSYTCEPVGDPIYKPCGVYDGAACACTRDNEIDGVNCCSMLISRSVEGVLEQDVSWCGRVIWWTDNKNDPGYITGTCVYLCDTPPF